MAVIKLVLAYDGTDFHGWARQPRHRTVEGVLTEFLERIVQHPVRLSVAGRTDAGVHARGQVASFESDAGPSMVQRAINGVLAPEVVVLAANVAPQGFDARLSATAREYRYRINTGDAPDPFSARFMWHLPKQLDLTAMRAAAKPLLGRHDFASFCSRSKSRVPTTRHLRRLTVSRRGDGVAITAKANGFLHQMIRILVGTLLEVGTDRRDPSDMKRILHALDRSLAAKAAPPHGLTLERVAYGAPRL